MWYLYLDESGDLGFDFVNKKPSKYFTITILAVSSQDTNRKLIKAVKKTLARKLNPRNKRKRIVEELKGSLTTYSVKKYLYDQVKSIPFGLYSITLNKKRVFERLIKQKEHIYNYITRLVLDQIPFENGKGARIQLIIDKSKGKPEVVEFNSYIRRQLQARIDPKTPLDIYHWDSKQTPGLQLCDMFCWGIFVDKERKNSQWRTIFEKKILFDDVYL